MNRTQVQDVNDVNNRWKLEAIINMILDNCRIAIREITGDYNVASTSLRSCWISSKTIQICSKRPRLVTNHGYDNENHTLKGSVQNSEDWKKNVNFDQIWRFCLQFSSMAMEWCVMNSCLKVVTFIRKTIREAIFYKHRELWKTKS